MNERSVRYTLELVVESFHCLLRAYTRKGSVIYILCQDEFFLLHEDVMKLYDLFGNE